MGKRILSAILAAGLGLAVVSCEKQKLPQEFSSINPVAKECLNNKIPLIYDEWSSGILCAQKPYISWNFECQKPLSYTGANQYMPPISDGWFLTGGSI